ncbi:MAG: response regulator transcription factor [Chloroflexi bacterium]|nr:response regulator transcription factor [Chloroflexota bacterium]
MICQQGADLAEIEEQEASQQPEAVFVDLGSIGLREAQAAVDQCRKLRVPVLAVLPREGVDDYDPALNPDELIVHPVSENELMVRVKQAVFRVSGPSGSQLLKVGDMTIDLERYDVTVSGRRVSLTYKEFQLLVLLASNPGRVYSRENLLSKVWGYDYLGGTRTVDVHVRRLRSKIESPGRSFIETIYLVGYRFRVAV